MAALDLLHGEREGLKIKAEVPDLAQSLSI